MISTVGLTFRTDTLHDAFVSDAVQSHGSPRLTLGTLLYEKAGRSSRTETDWTQLMREVAQRDQRALQALYDQTNRIVFTLIMRITNDAHAAEELTLDVFHDIWRNASSYDAARGPVIAWIMNQARSRAIDRLRFDQRKKRQGSTADVPAAVEHGDPQSAVHTLERRTLLLRALDTLAPEERQAIEVAFFSELTHAEVAEKLNWPLGTVKTRIRSALLKLRNTLGTELRP